MVGTLEKARSAAAALSALCDSAGGQESGATLFAQICASCHGEEGKGQQGDAGPLHSAAFLGLTSDQALRRIAVTGRPDLGMPDYRKLGAQRPSGQALDSREVADIVAYLASWRLAAPEGFSHVSGGAKER